LLPLEEKEEVGGKKGEEKESEYNHQYYIASRELITVPYSKIWAGV